MKSYLLVYENGDKKRLECDDAPVEIWRDGDEIGFLITRDGRSYTVAQEGRESFIVHRVRLEEVDTTGWV